MLREKRKFREFFFFFIKPRTTYFTCTLCTISIISRTYVPSRARTHKAVEHRRGRYSRLLGMNARPDEQYNDKRVRTQPGIVPISASLQKAARSQWYPFNKGHAVSFYAALDQDIGIDCQAACCRVSRERVEFSHHFLNNHVKF